MPEHHTQTSLTARLTEACGLPIERARLWWLVNEVGFARREAQADADLAYRGWCADRTRERYLAYRAAQDRADAAQDELAALHAHAAAQRG